MVHGIGQRLGGNEKRGGGLGQEGAGGGGESSSDRTLTLQL